MAGKNYQEVRRPDLAAEALLEAAEALIQCPGVRPAQTAALLDECRNACSRIEGKRGLLGKSTASDHLRTLSKSQYAGFLGECGGGAKLKGLDFRIKCMVKQNVL